VTDTDEVSFTISQQSVKLFITQAWMYTGSIIGARWGMNTKQSGAIGECHALFKRELG